MMYKLVNGHLPDVMNEVHTINDHIHNHFTTQCDFLLIKNIPMFMQETLEI